MLMPSATIWIMWRGRWPGLALNAPAGLATAGNDRDEAATMEELRKKLRRLIILCYQCMLRRSRPCFNQCFCAVEEIFGDCAVTSEGAGAWCGRCVRGRFMLLRSLCHQAHHGATNMALLRSCKN